MDPAELAGHLMAVSQRLDTLTQGLQDLQVENREIQHQLAILQATPGHFEGPEPKINPPEVFTGDRKKYRSFINACNLLFDLKPRTYRTDRIKVCTLISYLSGEPRAWADTYYVKNDPILTSYETFVSSMSLLYDDKSKSVSSTETCRGLYCGVQKMGGRDRVERC